MIKVELNIEGMHCGGCATGIQMVTEQMDGVGTTSVDLDAKKGSFEFDEAVTNADALISEIGKLGYQATVAE
ncbi:MAG: copper chaperone CopZ [Candidatus Azotimanducaceae bacterium]|jgi:copper chaperone CopZ